MTSAGAQPLAQTAAWRKASFCQSGECAEVAHEDGEILLRSSREPGVVIRLTAAEWKAFFLGVQAHEFDHLG
ncbi:MAG TPA: DUF397 domain-containing protein [Streptosporangiaceae bacterium]|jgi:hypothetical protein|nr:DUF397 domain-containing protein [Streptosporangiaceae bacterium]